jgi:hypothetical protein
MRFRHVYESALGDSGLASLLVAKADEAAEYTSLQVEILSVVEADYLLHIKPVSILDAEGKWQPVGHINQALVL